MQTKEKIKRNTDSGFWNLIYHHVGPKISEENVRHNDNKITITKLMQIFVRSSRFLTLPSTAILYRTVIWMLHFLYTMAISPQVNNNICDRSVQFWIAESSLIYHNTHCYTLLWLHLLSQAIQVSSRDIRPTAILYFVHKPWWRRSMDRRLWRELLRGSQKLNFSTKYNYHFPGSMLVSTFFLQKPYGW